LCHSDSNLISKPTSKSWGPIDKQCNSKTD
jgi:hypothetical protein